MRFTVLRWVLFWWVLWLVQVETVKTELCKLPAAIPQILKYTVGADLGLHEVRVALVV